MNTRLRIRSLVIVGTLGFALDATPSEAQFPVVPSCPQTSTPTVWSGSFLDTNTSKNGTSFNSGTSKLELQKTGSVFTATSLASPGTIMYAAVADFNNDGWPDFIGASEAAANDYLQMFRNYTWQNENCTTSACTAYSGSGAPNWSDPAVVIVPKFTQGVDLHTKYISTTTAVVYSGRYSLAAADFDGDGWPDLFEGYASTSGGYIISTLNMYLNAAANDGSGNATFKARYNAANASLTPSSVLGAQLWSAGNTQAVDYNKDGKMDVLIGNGLSGGSIRILLNNCPGTMQANGVFKCSSPPTFVDGGYLISNLNTVGATTDGFGTNVSAGTPTYAYADIDGDGLRDLVVGAPNCCTAAAKRLRLFKGCAGGTGCSAGLEKVASQSLAFNGGATDVFIADFSLDGKPDVIVATDNFNYNAGFGGETYYYQNNGTSTPLSGAPVKLTSHTSTNTDYDIGFLFDYDKDPSHSPDMMIADGNDATKYYVIADRVAAQYVSCGDAYSGIIDLGSLLSDEMVVTAARITPTFTLNGGTVTFWMSNEEPPNWVQASLCTGSATDYCVSFPKPIGRSVRWKAVMCSNSTHTATPTLTSMNAKFDYTEAKEHYRAGVVVNDGIAYVGAFHQPGDRGKFYGINAGLSTVYWDAAAKLDATADSSRKIYTAVANVPVRLDFTTASASDPLMQNLLQTPDTQSASDLITWVRSTRFGVGSPAIPLTKFGSVENSTPAVLTKPGRPNWYSFVTALDRTRIESFISANANRVPLALVGAKDGMIHAIQTRPSDISNTVNGTEAWAFIPPTVAAGMLKDFTNTTTANAAASDGENHPTIAAYPDGSPTLVDYNYGSGVFKTVAVVAEGNGGRSFTVLDVTQTIDPVSFAINGPTPMWSATPGDGEAGQAFSKPAVARVLIANAERYVVVAATGVDFSDTLGQKGRVVSAYDINNGQLMWKFQAKCPITSDITIFETDDTGEFGAPSLNGFADRAVFADQCGYVYKLAPGVDLAGGWYDNTGLGTIAANTSPDGKAQMAFFSTATTTGAVGAQRPIAGTIGARTDSSTRMVLFFGTGGLENFSTSLVNEFYAVYADTGAIRSKITGACTASGCEKFYGGTVVTPQQVILTRTIDPAIGTSSCDPGSAKIQALELNKDASNNFVTDFTLAVSSAVMGALYGDAGAIYFATLSGDVARIGTPRAANAGDDTTAGHVQGMGVGDQGTGSNATVGTISPFSLMGWRVVL